MKVEAKFQLASYGCSLKQNKNGKNNFSYIWIHHYEHKIPFKSKPSQHQNQHILLNKKEGTTQGN